MKNLFGSDVNQQNHLLEYITTVCYSGGFKGQASEEASRLKFCNK